LVKLRHFWPELHGHDDDLGRGCGCGYQSALSKTMLSIIAQLQKRPTGLFCYLNGQTPGFLWFTGARQELERTQETICLLSEDFKQSFFWSVSGQPQTMPSTWILFAWFNVWYTLKLLPSYSIYSQFSFMN